MPTCALRGDKNNALPMYPGITQVVKLSINHSNRENSQLAHFKFFSGRGSNFCVDTTLRWQARFLVILT